MKKEKTVILQTATNVNMILSFGRNIIDEALNRDVEIHILMSRYQSNMESIKKDLKNMNVTIHKASYMQELSIKALFNNLKAIFETYWLMLKLKPNIVHTRGSLMGYLGRITAFLARVRNIYHHQDDFFHREESASRFKKKISQNIDYLLSKISTKLFFVSNTIMKEAERIGIESHKCVMVGHDLHPLFSKNFEKKNDEKHHLIKQGIPNSESKFIVGTIARIEDFKGIETILEVAKSIKSKEENIKFIIRGNGSKYDKYKDMVDDLRLDDTVFMTKDFLPAEEMPRLFKSFDVFFLPTRREGFGMVFAEAMAMKVPVVCPKIYPVVEVVPEDLGYVIEPENVDKYTEAILDVYQNQKKRVKITNKAFDYAVNRWGSKKSAKKVVKTLLESVDYNFEK